MFAAEEFLAGGFNVYFFGEREEGVEDGFCDEVLGEIEEDGGGCVIGRGPETMVLVKSLGIAIEEFAQLDLAVLGVVELLEFLPGGILYMHASLDILLCISFI